MAEWTVDDLKRWVRDSKADLEKDIKFAEDRKDKELENYYRGRVATLIIVGTIVDKLVSAPSPPPPPVQLSKLDIDGIYTRLRNLEVRTTRIETWKRNVKDVIEELGDD